MSPSAEEQELERKRKRIAAAAAEEEEEQEEEEEEEEEEDAALTATLAAIQAACLPHLDGSVSKMSRLVVALCKLHNFCIDCKHGDTPPSTPMDLFYISSVREVE